MTVSDPPAQSICIGCGLCCDGTLHPEVYMERGDDEIVAAEGLSIFEKGGKPVFAQPCPKFAGGSCSIYDRRPGVCRHYRCKLLKEAEEGKVGLAEARARIRTTKSLIETVRLHSPEAVTAEGRIMFAKRLRETRAKLLVARALLDLSALEYALERWFMFQTRKSLESPEEPPSG